MITDYTDRTYLERMQKENRSFARNLGRTLVKVAPYVAGGILITTLLVGGINYVSKYTGQNTNPEFSQLTKKLDQEKRFNKALFKAGGQLK